MNDPSFHLNEVAHAYERNFVLLEAAREEYAKTVTEILRQFHQRLVERIGSLDWALQVVPSLKEDGFRSEVECLLVVEERATGFRVFAKAATPQGGLAGCLRIIAYGWFDEKLAPVTRDQAFDRSGDFPEADRSSGFLESRELMIGDGNMEVAVDAVLDALERISHFALQQVEEEDRTMKVKEVLERALVNLRPPSRIAKAWSTKPSLAWWKGMRYIQPSLPDCPGFWVGYHLRDGRIMYGHHVISKAPEFAERFYSLVGATPVQPNNPNSYGGHPAGVILERDDLMGKSPDELERLVVELFQRFYDLLLDSPMGTSRASNT
jgi:hypothetical protein